MMDSIITQNNNITKTSDQKNPNKLIGDQIFESFMMVGCDKQEIIEFEKENSNLYLEV